MRFNRWFCLVVILSLFVSEGPLLAVAAPSAELPGDSLYQIGSRWKDQAGQETTLLSLRGSRVVLSLVYLTCKFSCPMVVSEMRALESKLSARALAGVRFVLVSIDPSRDTPAVALRFMQKRKILAPRWRFLTAKDDAQVRELAASLDYKYKRDKSGEFTHSFMLAVLDENGVLRARVDGANQDHADLLAALNPAEPPAKR